MTTSPYELLIQKLDAFTRKYYKNQLLRGVIYVFVLVLLLFLFVLTLEYFGHYSSAVRAVLFYSFVGITSFLVVRFMALPLAGLYRIGKTISNSEAAQIIGIHFPEVKDKLINTLQLHERNRASTDMSLLEAAIQQKTSALTPIPFAAAIDLKKNLKYARFVVVPLLLYGLVYLISPGMITDGSMRVLQYNKVFKLKAPFDFKIQNEHLETEQYADFELEVEVSGKELPNEVFVVKNGRSFKMLKTDNTHFTYTFNSVKENIDFMLEGAGFNSNAYRLEVLSKPHLVNYGVHIHYPSYLNKADEQLNNPGDLTVPAGAILRWRFLTKQTQILELGFGKVLSKATSKEANQFTFEKKIFLSTPYFIKTSNDQTRLHDSLLYQINVVPDAYPTITVEENADSNANAQRYFVGDISDDYGFSKLTFNYHFVKSDQEDKIKQGNISKQLMISKGEKSLRFYHQFLMQEIGLAPSDELVYYFEVWDNDGVLGAKSTKSKTMVLKVPSTKELEEKSDAQSGALKDKMEEAIVDAKQLQKELKTLEQKMLEKRELTWEEKKKLEQIIERQKKLAEQIEAIKNEQKQINKEEQSYKQQNEELIQKQQQLEKLFNEVMNDDMKKLMKQLEQMMQQQNKDQIKQEMDKLQLNNKDVEKELDRMLEQYKQLEVEKRLNDAVKKLDDLAQKQKELADKSEQLSKDNKLTKEEKKQVAEEIKQEQQKLSEAFKDAEKQLKDIEEKNKQLEQPKQLEKTEDEQKEIEKQQSESQDELEQNQSKKAAESQKVAADKMKEMSEKMKKGMESEEEKETEINEESLREILENTIQLSKDQEQLMEDFKQVSNYNPQYVEMAKQQNVIKNNAKIIEDSLLSLSKKVPEISSFVNREVSKLNDHLDKSVEAYGSRNIGQIRLNQQQAMMNANNLGVMLSEVLQQMQQQMQGKSSGKNGTKPKKGKGEGQGKGKSMSSMKKMQEELNKQLREGLNKQEGKGDKPGEKPGGKPGDKPGMGSQEYARMAAQQMAIRQQMQKMMSEMGTKEKEQMGGTGKLQEMQKLMEQTERELFNKKLSNQMLQRQEEIMTRMLESEKAERKQEQEKKREAEQAKEKSAAQPPTFEPYIKQKQKEQELLQTIPVEMQPYYKEKAKTYFNKVEQ